MQYKRHKMGEIIKSEKEKNIKYKQISKEKRKCIAAYLNDKKQSEITKILNISRKYKFRNLKSTK